MTYSVLNISYNGNHRRLVDIDGQILFEKFDGTNISTIGTFKSGICCSLENMTTMLLNHKNDKEVIKILETMQDKDETWLCEVNNEHQ